jgi:hypothetical protein
MPLVHSKTPKAFKKNIKTEMQHGKPQKQAVAIAYSEKREAEHEHAGGGKICMACGGEACSYAKGGFVNYDVLDSAQDEPGVSAQGRAVRWGNRYKGKDEETRSGMMEHAKEEAEARAHAEKSYGGKPNIKGLAEGGRVLPKGEKTDEYMERSNARSPEEKHERHLGILKKHVREEPISPSGRAIAGLYEKEKSKKFAEGGEVEESEHMNLDDDDMDSEISEALGHELMGAIESKEPKKIMEALEACVLSCMMKGK